MTSIRSRQQAPIGSGPWITDEQENIRQLVDQELEDFTFSARNEVEWLNEHMGEIFASQQFNVTDVFKTPGKLRCKTPRTIRKNPLEARVPLSNVFAAKQNLQPDFPPSRPKHASPIVVARDPSPTSTLASKPVKQPTDSGYHGLTDDEMDVDPATEMPAAALQGVQTVKSASQRTTSEGRRTTEGSFHSAQEAMATTATDAIKEAAKAPTNRADEKVHDQKTEEHTEVEPPETWSVERHGLDAMTADEIDDTGSPSDGSTPDHLLTRKSSLTFAALPPREPLKKSIGLPNADQGRNSYYQRLTGGRSTQPNHNDEADKMDLDDDTHALDRDMSDTESQTRTLHNKSSTQRLTDRINMLGKTTRPSKSIPSVAPVTQQVAYPEIPSNAGKSVQDHIVAPVDQTDDDDWIPELQRPGLHKNHPAGAMKQIPDERSRGPSGLAETAAEPSPQSLEVVTSPMYVHGKSASTTVLPSASKATIDPGVSHTKTVSVSNPMASEQSFTPVGSPKRMQDGGALSASKNKLQSLMKTAKGLFTSSAGISAAAKMETLSPSIKRAVEGDASLYPSLESSIPRSLPPDSPTREEGRRTRSSTEREQKRKEKEAMEQRRVAEKLEKARQEQRQQAAQYKQDRDMPLPSLPPNAKSAQPTRSSPRKVQESRQEDPESKLIVRPTSIQQPPQRPGGQARRPAKPAPATKPQAPQRVNINLHPHPRQAPSTASLAQTLNESLPPPAAPKQTGFSNVGKKTSNASTATTASTTSFKSSQSGKPRALVAAEKKKAEDERERQRREEQRAKVARQRAIQQEQARREEQKQRAEAEKRDREKMAAEDAKKTAQREAIEKRRLENAKKQEDFRNVQSQNKMDAPAPSRVDLGGPRPPSRMMNTAQPPPNRSVINNSTTSSSKQQKRPFDDEESRPIIRVPGPGTNYHATANDSKRRKTEDEFPEPPKQPTMGAPPVRQSGARKEQPKPSIFSNTGYAPAPPAPSTLKSGMHPHHGPTGPGSHRVAHPIEMAKYASGKIPFSEAPNPPQANGYFKTPASQRPPVLAKSSPQIPNADDHPLPEINTDSESDSDASPSQGSSFPVPAWAQKEAIEAALIDQEQSLDPDAIFGPIGQIQMDEIFRGTDKGRMKRWRDRTSSANWERSGDLLTREEMDKDREGRERLRAQGAWSYELGRS